MGVGHGMTQGGDGSCGRIIAMEIGAENFEEAGGGGGREDGGEEAEGVGVGEEFGAGAGGLESAFVEEGEAVAAGMDFRETAGGEEDGFSLGSEGGEEVFEFDAGGGVEVGKGGVEQEQVGFFDEGVGEVGTASGGVQGLLGVRTRTLVASLQETGEPDEQSDRRGLAAAVLRDVANAGLAGARARGATEDADGAFGGAEVAGEELEEGSFAGAGSAEEAVDLAGAQVEGEVVEGAGAVVVEGEGDVAELGERWHGRGIFGRKMGTEKWDGKLMVFEMTGGGGALRSRRELRP